MDIKYLAIVGGLTLFTSTAFALEPIPGSIIYNGQPKTRLQKAPVGSTFTHEFSLYGNTYSETYRIKPDRSLELLNRRQLNRH
ncbi:hypothetical protein [Endobacterium cereale]|uniref:hypothetical protein n=1 Tax=Endobacterium cereale TaxID=2663029 RepID=UPI002B4A7F7C|nr:hypothetical protein [Endobacterium cereale]MEB2848077.1 hypothetical protein [Endobacterium cereale]